LKRSIIAITGILLSAGAFALDVSVGASVSGGFFFNQMNQSNSGLGISYTFRNTAFPFQAEAYVDAQYVQVGVGYRVSVGGHQWESLTSSGTTTTAVDADTGTKGYVSFSAYLKYPFNIGQYLLQPLLGFEYDVNAMDLDSSGNDLRGSLSGQQLADENQFWVKAGIGSQIPLANWGYLRARFLIGWKMLSAAESSAVSTAINSGYDATLFSLEPELGIAVGFNL
jgi:hypothetical protein